MAQVKIKNRLMAAINSVSAAGREAQRKDIERIKEMEQRAEQLTQEEIKSQGERDMLQMTVVSLEEELEKIKKASKRLREYDWKEELEKIHNILHTRLNSLITRHRKDRRAEAVSSYYCLSSS